MNKIKPCDNIQALELLKALRDSALRDVRERLEQQKALAERLIVLDNIVTEYNKIIDESTDLIITKASNGNTNANK